MTGQAQAERHGPQRSDRHPQAGERAPDQPRFSTLVALGLLAIVVPLVVVIGPRHVGGSYDDVALNTAFWRAARPLADRSWYDRLLYPDPSARVRVEVHDVRFHERGLVLLGDGTFLHVVDASAVQEWLEHARRSETALRIEATCGDGAVRIQRLTAGERTWSIGGELRLLDRFGPSDAPPPTPRGASPVVRVSGRVRPGVDGLLFEPSSGGVVWLRAGSRRQHDFLASMGRYAVPVDLQLVPDTAVRAGAGLPRRARCVAASVGDFHLVGPR